METRTAAPGAAPGMQRASTQAPVVGLHFQTALLPTGWADNVRVEIAAPSSVAAASASGTARGTSETGPPAVAGTIVRVETSVPAQPGDERGFAALPGVPNLHSHAFQRAIAGLTEQRGDRADSFWTWRSLMYRFVETMSPDDIEAITAQAYMEMLEGGFTRVGEFHYLHHDVNGSPYANRAELGARIASAAAATGIGLTLLPVFYAHGGFSGAPASEAQRRFLNDVDGYARLLEASRAAVSSLPGAIVGVAPHSLRAVTPGELEAIVPLAGDAPIHIHIAEQTREVEECIAWSGARPVQWLLDHASVQKQWCLVHATHMTGQETQRLAASGAVAGLCPITEANLGDGLFPAPAFQVAGGVMGIGSDSNVLIRVNEELRLLEYGQRLHARARNVLAAGAGTSTGRTLYEAAVKGGAQALGARTTGPFAGAAANLAGTAADLPGTGTASNARFAGAAGAAGAVGLAVGASADIVSLRAHSPVFAARKGDALLDSFIFAGGDRCIDGVWSAGRKVVSQGVHQARESIEARFRATLERLLRA